MNNFIIRGVSYEDVWGTSLYSKKIKEKDSEMVLFFFGIIWKQKNKIKYNFKETIWVTLKKFIELKILLLLS